MSDVLVWFALPALIFGLGYVLGCRHMWRSMQRKGEGRGMGTREYACKWCREIHSVHAGVGWPRRLAERYGVELCPNHYAEANGEGFLPKMKERIPYGQERGMAHLYFPDRPCHDCHAAEGHLHDPGCDAEECPTCHWQLLSCGHDKDWWPA